MAQPFIGEIRMFAGNFAPVNWMFCDGSVLPISEFVALFELIGTTYGGDGQSTFALPDLRGRVPIHQGNGFIIGQNGGVETVTLSVAEIPAHRHYEAGNGGSGLSSPTGNVLGNPSGDAIYVDNTPSAQMSATANVAVGGGQAHENLMPYQCVTYIISLFGVFPSQT